MFFCMFCSFSLLSLPFPDWCLIPYSRELIFPVLHLQIKFPGKPKPSLLFIIDKLTSANTHTTHTSASSYCIKPITNIRTSTTTVVMKGNPLSKKEMESELIRPLSRSRPAGLGLGLAGESAAELLPFGN